MVGLKRTIEKRKKVEMGDTDITYKQESIRQRTLFTYLADIVTLFIDTGSDIDIDLIYEIELMYEQDNYREATHEHKELLEGILDVAKMTLEYVAGYRDIVDDIGHMIAMMWGIKEVALVKGCY